MADKSKPYVDKGYAWIVLVAACLANFIFDGIVFTFGIFYIEFLGHFQEGRGVTSWIGSVMAAVYGLAGPLASVLSKKFGCRPVTIVGSCLFCTGFVLSTFAPSVPVLIITYGVIPGIGVGFISVCQCVMIGNYFAKWRPLAMGITSCGSGLGTFAFAPFSAYLIGSYGWKGALLIIAAITLQGVVIGSLFRPPPFAEKVNLEKSKEKLLDLDLLRNWQFLLFCLSSFSFLMGMFVPFTFLPDYAMHNDIEYEKAAFLLSIIGIVNICGRLAAGFIAEKCDTLVTYILVVIIGGVAVGVIPMTNNYIVLSFASAIFGASVGAYFTLSSLILIELMGLERLSSSFGFLNAFRGLATLIGTPVAGWLFDVTNNYELAFWLAGSALVAAGLVCLPLCFLRHCVKVTLHEEKEKPIAITGLLKAEDKDPEKTDVCHI